MFVVMLISMVLRIRLIMVSCLLASCMSSSIYGHAHCFQPPVKFHEITGECARIHEVVHVSSQVAKVV